MVVEKTLRLCAARDQTGDDGVRDEVLTARASASAGVVGEEWAQD